MRKNIIIALVCFIATGIAICSAGNGMRLINKDNESTVSRSFNNLKSFDELYAYNGFDVTYTVGATRSVTVEVSERALEYIRVEVDNGRLEIGINREGTGSKLNNVKIKATVTGPALKNVSATNGADIDIISPMTVKGSLSVSSSNGADIEINGPVTVQGNLSVSSTSGADIDMESVTALNVKVSSGSGADVDIDGIKTTDLTVISTGGADASVEGITAKSVTASVSGGADIKLKGTAEVVDLSSDGAGTLKASGLKALKGSANASSCGSISCNVANLSKSQSSLGSVSNRR